MVFFDVVVFVVLYGMCIVCFDFFGVFLLFNFDVEYLMFVVVCDLIDCLNVVDGVLIVSLEYVYGVLGVMKNVLDWVVGCEVVVYKLVVVLNVLLCVMYVDVVLCEMLLVMLVCIVEFVLIVLLIFGSWFDVVGIVVYLLFVLVFVDVLYVLCVVIVELVLGC